MRIFYNYLFIYYALLLFFLSILTRHGAGLPPIVGEEFQLSGMSGTWFLAYTSLIPKSTYLKDTTCAVGYYSAVGEDALLKGLPAVPTIDVYNAATKDGETIGGTGKLWQFLSYARPQC